MAWTGHSLEQRDQETYPIIGAAIEVHRVLGPGLLESAYEECLCHELTIRGIPFRRQVEIPVKYKGVSLACGYTADLVVNGNVVIELKVVEHIARVHEAQLLTYMKLLCLHKGLLINFHGTVLRQGIVRRVL
jgi:GxxExxY protein